MDLITFVQAAKCLWAHYGDYSTITEILLDKSVELFETIGQTDFEAGITALADASISEDPAREVQAALVLLRSALQNFSKAAEKRSVGQFLGFGVQRSTLLRQACECALGITLMYRILGDSGLATKYISVCCSYFDKYDRATRDEWVFGGPVRPDVIWKLAEYEFQRLDQERKNLDDCVSLLA